MNDRINTIKATMRLDSSFLKCDFRTERLQKDADYQAAYCLTEELLKVYAEQDLTSLEYLGKRNLQIAIAHWRSEVRQATKRIKAADRLLDFLKSHSTSESLRQYAESFTGVEDWYGRELDESIGKFVPRDRRAFKRKENTSTLNVCGWCKFCRGGICRGGCKLTCSCKLLPDRQEKVEFDTPCLFRELVDKDPMVIREGMASFGREKAALAMHKRDCLERIAILTKCREAAEDKPALPCCCLGVDYPEGERVVVLANQPEKQDPETGAMPLYWGTVIPSEYRHFSFQNRPKLVYRDYHDYMAYMCADIQMSNYPAIMLDADSGMSDEPWYAVGSGFSMTEKDFNYLCAHEDYAKLWLATVGNWYNPDWVRRTWADAFRKNTK